MHDCRYFQQNVIRCLDCDDPAEIVYMCAHQVKKTETVKCACERGGRHRQPEKPKRGLFGRKK